MSLTSSIACCRCDRLDLPPKPRIPAGLSALPRQLAGFPEFRLAMLRQIPAHQLLDAAEIPATLQRPLRDWRAREGSDLGIMLVEMWAYVLDLLAFYEERIANESYLPTAVRPASLQELVALIGYLPRPAVGAEVMLALVADTGKGLIRVPAGTGFRSGAFAGEKPQVFEASADGTVDPALNEWTLAPIVGAAFDGRFTMPPGDARLARDDVALFTWGNSSASARVQSVTPMRRLDGKTYLDLALLPPPAIGAGVAPRDISVFKPTALSGVSEVTSSRSTIQLDSLQGGIRVGDRLVIERDDGLLPFQVTDLGPGTLYLDSTSAAARAAQLSPQATLLGFATPNLNSISPRAVRPFLQVTRLTVSPALPAGWASPVSKLTVHFGMVRAGSLTAPAKTRLGVDDLLPSAAFVMPVEPPTLEPPGTVLLAGADGGGANLTASVSIAPDAGTGSLAPQQSAPPFATDLRTPVTVYGNLIHATRGESVPNEVLGSGDATIAFQSFKLKKKPLTYLTDESAPNGRRSTLAVRVNAILWSEVWQFLRDRPPGRSLHRAAKRGRRKHRHVWRRPDRRTAPERSKERDRDLPVRRGRGEATGKSYHANVSAGAGHSSRGESRRRRRRSGCRCSEGPPAQRARERPAAGSRSLAAGFRGPRPGVWRSGERPGIMGLGCHDAACGRENPVHLRRRFDRAGPAEVSPRAVRSKHASRRERSDPAGFEPDSGSDRRSAIPLG